MFVAFPCLAYIDKEALGNPNSVHCSHDSPAPDVEACLVNVSALMVECNEKNNYGYGTEVQPCVLLRLNRVAHCLRGPHAVFRLQIALLRWAVSCLRCSVQLDVAVFSFAHDCCGRSKWLLYVGDVLNITSYCDACLSVCLCVCVSDDAQLSLYTPTTQGATPSYEYYILL